MRMRMQFYEINTNCTNDLVVLSQRSISLNFASLYAFSDLLTATALHTGRPRKIVLQADCISLDSKIDSEV